MIGIYEIIAVLLLATVPGYYRTVDLIMVHGS